MGTKYIHPGLKLGCRKHERASIWFDLFWNPTHLLFAHLAVLRLYVWGLHCHKSHFLPAPSISHHSPLHKNTIKIRTRMRREESMYTYISERESREKHKPQPCDYISGREKVNIWWKVYPFECAEREKIYNAIRRREGGRRRKRSSKPIVQKDEPLKLTGSLSSSSDWIDLLIKVHGVGGINERGKQILSNKILLAF